jgi:3',5'-cyclic AMP phosphodiesterase CpdA
VTGPPIVDLRRGDYDDNRTSPHAGSLRSLILASALEFNYLKASIGFLTLIVAPALFVGIVPSVVVTYGRMKLDVALGHRPVVALLMLALLAGSTVLLGRPLVSKALECFWRLQYTLLFPIFVAVREIVRSLVERVSGNPVTAEEIDRGRRFGTIIGGLLLAVGGIGLAVALVHSYGLQLVNIERVAPWVVVRAALRNAAVILGISTAIESLYWVCREIADRGSVEDWEPSPSGRETFGARVAHLSDLHVVGERYGYRMEAGARGPRGNEPVQRAFQQLLAIHESAPLDRVLVTGDVTDAGTRAEWAEFLDLLRDHPLRDRISFVPGNHDVNIVDRSNPGRFDLPWSPRQALRRLRTVLALDAIQGDRARLVDRDSGNLGPLLKDYLRENGRAGLLRELAEDGTQAGRREMVKVWERIFPLVESPQGSDRYGLILLDSNARSHFALTNAIGVVTPSQLKALKAVLHASPRSAWIVLLHHQVVEYPVASISLTDRIGLALVNAKDVLKTLAPHAGRCLVFHGHRHRDWIGISRGVVLCSAPSATLGSQGAEEYRGTFYIHKITVGPDGSIRLAAPERVTVSPDVAQASRPVLHGPADHKR